MPQFNVCVPHKIGPQAALARVKRFLDDISVNHAHRMSDIRQEWRGNRLEFAFTTLGVQVEGTLVVEDDAVQISGPLQMPVLLFRSQLEETIKRELEIVLQ
jgi:hypothetical protein